MQQFNFAKNWKTKIQPIVNQPEIQKALQFGMLMSKTGYEIGKPPYLYGRISGNKVRKDSLKYYQPNGLCHYIAPFSYAVAKELYPKLKLGFISSHAHSVVVGLESEDIRLVFDILLFEEKTAKQSIEFVKTKDWELFEGLYEYLASFSKNREAAMKVLTTHFNVGGCG